MWAAPPVDADRRGNYLDEPASRRTVAPGNIAENHRMPTIRQLGLLMSIVVATALSGCRRAAEEAPATPEQDRALSYSRVGETLEADVAGKEKMHLETGEQGVALPHDFPSDVPLYPGATLTLAVTIDDLLQVTLHTADDLPEVVKFYREQLEAADWKIEAELDVKKGDMLSADKDGRTCSVLLTRKSDNVTVISITLGKR
jgi:hypothetical protein